MDEEPNGEAQPHPFLPGLKFVLKHSLTNRETLVFTALLEKPMTTSELSSELKSPTTTLHHVVMRLKLKGLVTLKAKTAKKELIHMVKKI